VEVLLNLVWLITASWLFVLLRRQSCHNAPSRRIWQQRLVFTVLSLVLLPVISMTDDLHAMPTLAEGERAYLKDSAADSPSHAARTVFLLPAGSDALLDAPFFCFGTIDAPKDAPAVPSRFFPPSAGRAPPAYPFLNGIA
jgi:hypothetical protein